ncbi:MAG: hypothetical protein QOF93_1366 [Verrucomicrobiota bacterium]|jgi:hypothetical protein
MADPTVPPPLPAPPAPISSAPRTSRLAIWSSALAVLFFIGGWLFTAIPAVICGHLARSKIRKSNGALGGTRIATAGLILSYIGVVLGLMGIPLLVGMIKADRERLHRLSTEKNEIASADGKLKVTVTGLWTKMPELNKEATLQVGEKSKEMYLIVFSDTKSVAGNITLEQHHQLTRDRMLQKMKNPLATTPVPLTIDGRPALQDEVSGRPGGADIIFLNTTVDDGDHFQRILAWALKSRWQKQNEQLREATNSFHSEK